MLHLIVGPMYSGKTSDLLGRLSPHVFAGQEVLYINSTLDTRTDGPFSTHNPLLTGTPVGSVLKVKKLADVDVGPYATIGVDEAQFFDDLMVVQEWVDRLRKVVYVASLDGDSERRPFGNVLKLIPYCDSVIKLTAVCVGCAASSGTVIRAPFTERTEATTEQVKVGGTESYRPLCRSCYLLPHTRS